jgi:hypothetical protein
MDEATDKASVATFVEDVLAGTGWELQAVRRRSSRLEPPDWYWAQFDIIINKEDEDERRLRLVAKGALNSNAWARLSERLTNVAAGRRSSWQAFCSGRKPRPPTSSRLRGA